MNPECYESKLRAVFEGELGRLIAEQRASAPPNELQVELISAKIMFVGVLRKLGGEIRLSQQDMVVRPGDFRIVRSFDFDTNELVIRLSNEPASTIIEEEA